jgi:hypothetical protein
MNRIAALVLAALVLAGPAAAQPQRPTPPETNEIAAAALIPDAAARLKEFERIKAVYPKSSQLARIDAAIYEAKIDLAATIEAILGLQKTVVGQGQGTVRMTSYVQAAGLILGHPRLASFDKAKVLAAVLGYRDGLVKAAAQPETFTSMPDRDAQQTFTATNLRYFDLLIAEAQANADDGDAALASLDRYKAAGGDADSEYMSALGDAYARLGRDKEAYGAYLGAAVQNFRGAADKARAMYARITGRTDGFENRLDALLKALPYRPAPFTPSKKWKGKTVLAEIFTDADNPSSAAVDLGYEGLVDTYPAQYLAILAFHVPLPGPDPLTNPATKKRQDYYGIAGQPTRSMSAL